MADDWIELPFSEAVLLNPVTPLKKGSTYPFVDMAAVTVGSRDVTSSEQREFNGSGSRFQDRDTLMARITPCLENGKLARFLSPTDQKVGHGSTEFIVVRGKPEITDTDFAYYLTISPEIRSFAISQMTGSSGRQRVPTDSLGGIAVLIPSLKEQRKIVKVLRDLDDKIAVNQRMNATLEAMTRTLFQSWFVDFDPVRAKLDGNNPIGINEVTAKLFPNAFQDSSIGHIPKGWEIRDLDKIADYLNGLALQKYPPGDGPTFPVIKIAQLRKGDVIGADRCGTELPKQFIVEDGDVLFSWSGSLEVELWCGGTGALNQHLFKVTSQEFPKWFYYLWTLHHLDEFRLIAASKATTMGHIQRSHITDAKVVVPPRNLLDAMTHTMSPIIDQLIANRIQSRTLAVLRDTLLPKLLSGELSVENLQP